MNATPNKINTPQIFIMYLPGMFGTLLANIMMHHELCADSYEVGNSILTKEGRYTAHKGGYKDMIEDFHNVWEIQHLYKKNDEELYDFFSPMNHVPLGIHRLASYDITDFGFERVFNKIVRIVVTPKEEKDRDAWISRSLQTSVGDITTQYWYPLVKKKGIKNLPKYFVDGLVKKEKIKYHEYCYNLLLEKKENLKNKNCFYFDPKDVRNIGKIQELIDNVCDSLNIARFIVPADKIKALVDANHIFLNKIDQSGIQ